MRKLGFCVTALVASALASCSNEENIVAPVKEAEPFVAVVAEGESRTSLSGNSVLWTNDVNEALSIFRKNGYNTKYVLSSLDEETNTATFKYSGEYDDDSQNVTGLTKNYAVYPYQDNMTITNTGVVTVNIPSSQTYSTDTFDPKAAFMFAVADAQTLAFKNANALLKLNFSKMPGDGDYTIQNIELSSASKALSGSATITMSDDVPIVALENKTATNNTLTLQCSDVVVKSTDVSTPTVLYLVVTPGTYSAKDLTLKFTVSYGGETKTIEKVLTETVEIDRNSIWNISYILGSEDFTGSITGFGSTDADAAQ